MGRLDKIIRENINRFLIKEGLPRWKEFGCPFNDYEKVDISNWNNIGKVNYNPYASNDFTDIWSNPQDYHEYAFMLHKYNGIGTCIGDLSSVPASVKSRVEIYPEFRDTDASIPFLGAHKTEEDKLAHKEFMSKLNIQDGKVVLQHNSNVIIKDGMLSSGHEMQGYSKNSDFGWYSWASKKIGNDQSNAGQYTYYCLVNIDDIYDFQNDMERFKDLRKAAYSKPYVAMYWGDDTDAIAVVSFTPTPISYIYDKSNGKQYDANWNEI